MPNVLKTSRRVSVKYYAPETLTYRDAIVAAGSSIAVASLDAVDVFVRTCKDNAIWAKLLDVGVFAGANLTAALVKLKHAGQGVLTNNNFIAGDYVETGVNGGLNANGTTKYLGTGFNAATSLPDNAHLGFYLREDVALTGNRALIGSLNGSEHYMLGSILAQSDTITRMGQLVTASQAAPLTKGFILGSRQSASLLRLSREGTAVATSASAVVHTKPAFGFNLFAWNAAGTAGAFVSGRGSFYSIGAALTDGEALVLSNAVRALQLSLGRLV